MSGRIESGQLVTVTPVDPSTVKAGDVVLCKVHGAEYVHLVKAVQDGRFLIGGVRSINGWIGHNGIFGLVVKIED